MNRIYLDHAATTPVAAEVRAAMIDALTKDFGNPSSLHSFGQEARSSVERARQQVADAIGAQPEEIVFTGGGTEADNLALIGGARANAGRGRHIITSAIEHHAILHTCDWMADNGWEVTVAGVDQYGRVDLDEIAAALRADTVLVSIMLANNEVGTIQPIADIARLAHRFGALMHTDAVQALGQLPIKVDGLGVDLLTMSGHKIYGPKGIGALYIRDGVEIEPIIRGGGHEHNLRAGTENVPGIVGLGTAAELAATQLEQRRRHLTTIRDRLKDGLFDRIGDLRLNGHPEDRLPNNLNVSVRFVEGESLLLNLDLEGIAVSSGSACTAGSLSPSHVLAAMGVPRGISQGSIRMSVGMDNTEEQIDRVLEAMPELVSRLREMSPLGRKGNGGD